MTGRFLPGNTAALEMGHRSPRFWAAAERAVGDIEAAIIADAGHSSADASRALQLAASGLGQAVLVRDSAFARMVETGGPMTEHDRARRAFTLWLQAMDRVERLLRLVGLRRVPRDAADVAAALAALHSAPVDATPAKESR